MANAEGLSNSWSWCSFRLGENPTGIARLDLAESGNVHRAGVNRLFTDLLLPRSRRGRRSQNRLLRLKPAEEQPEAEQQVEGHRRQLVPVRRMHHPKSRIQEIGKAAEPLINRSAAR